MLLAVGLLALSPACLAQRSELDPSRGPLTRDTDDETPDARARRVEPLQMVAQRVNVNVMVRFTDHECARAVRMHVNAPA